MFKGRALWTTQAIHVSKPESLCQQPEGSQSCVDNHEAFKEWGMGGGTAAFLLSEHWGESLPDKHRLWVCWEKRDDELPAQFAVLVLFQLFLLGDVEVN